jgi:hypothetical protein
MIMRLGIPIALLAYLAFPAAAQTPCGTPEHRRFDFWLGSWKVLDSAGTELGRNRIARLHPCALTEAWRGADGSAGMSVNLYDQWARVWHQTWVDSNGLLLQLDGGWRDTSMVLEGERVSPAGTRVRHRISWTPRTDSSVIQHWQRRPVGSAEWSTVFWGRYVRASGAPSMGHPDTE